MSIAGHALAVGKEIELPGGSTMAMKPLNYLMIAQYCQWLEQRARASIFSSTKGMNTAMIELQLSALQKSIAAGAYESGGDAFTQSLSTEAGQRKMMALMLGGNQAAEDATYELIADNLTSTQEVTLWDKAALTMQELNNDPLAIRQRVVPNLG